MHFTPPVQTIYALRQALDEYFAEGEEAKWKRHLSVFEEIHAGLKRLGFRDLIRRELQAGLVVSQSCSHDNPYLFVHLITPSLLLIQNRNLDLIVSKAFF